MRAPSSSDLGTRLSKMCGRKPHQARAFKGVRPQKIEASRKLAMPADGMCATVSPERSFGSPLGSSTQSIPELFDHEKTVVSIGP
jgi:hypothetical protein